MRTALPPPPALPTHRGVHPFESKFYSAEALKEYLGEDVDETEPVLQYLMEKYNELTPRDLLPGRPRGLLTLIRTAPLPPKKLFLALERSVFRWLPAIVRMCRCKLTSLFLGPVFCSTAAFQPSWQSGAKIHGRTSLVLKNPKFC